MPRIQYRPLVATPELAQDWHEEQQPAEVTWPELFLDLYFVAAVSTLSHLFKGAEPDLPNAGRVLLYHAIIFLVWSDFATFKTRFRLRGLVFRCIGLSLQLGVLAMVIGFGHDTARYRLLAGGYAAARTAMAAAYAVVGAALPRARALAALNASADAGLACLAGVVAAGWPAAACGYAAALRFVGLALAVEVALPVLPSLLFPRHDVPIHVEHMSERLGQLVMLHLGEGVIGFATTPLAHTSQQYAAVGLAATLVWSLHLCYYHVTPDQHQHAYRHSRPRGLLFFFSHWPLAVAILLLCSALRMMLGTFSPSGGDTADAAALARRGRQLAVSRHKPGADPAVAPLPPPEATLMLCVAYAAVLHLLLLIRATHYLSADPEHKAVRFQEARGAKAWWHVWWCFLLAWPLPVYLLPLAVSRLNVLAARAGCASPAVSTTTLLAVLAGHALLLTGAESVLAHKVTQQPVAGTLMTGQGEEGDEEGDEAAIVLPADV